MLYKIIFKLFAFLLFADLISSIFQPDNNMYNNKFIQYYHFVQVYNPNVFSYTPAEKQGRDTQKEIKRKGKLLFFPVTKKL